MTDAPPDFDPKLFRTYSISSLPDDVRTWIRRLLVGRFDGDLIDYAQLWWILQLPAERVSPHGPAISKWLDELKLAVLDPQHW